MEDAALDLSFLLRGWRSPYRDRDLPPLGPRMPDPVTDRPSRRRYCAMGWLTSAAALAYLCRVSLGVAESTIREDLGLDLEDSGWILGAFFWAYASFTMPAAVFAHSRGSRLALTVFAVGWSGATAAMGLAPLAWAGFGVLLVTQLAMGVAQAGLFPSSYKSVSTWLPLGRRTLGCSLLALGMQAGAIAAGGLTGQLLELDPEGKSWRWIFFVYAVPGLVWSVFFWRDFRDEPETDVRVNSAELALLRADTPAEAARPGAPEPTPWRVIFDSNVLWLLCGQQICRASGYIFFATWFPTFLQETQGVSPATSGMLQGVVLAASLVGSLMGGLLTDWVWKCTGSLRMSRAGVGGGCLFLSGVFILAAYFFPWLEARMVLMSLGALFAMLGGVSANAASVDVGNKHVPQVFGIVNMSGNFAAAATPVIVGRVFETTSNWSLVLIGFAVVYFVGAGCMALVDPTRKIHSSGSSNDS